jgi:hypothetical protein
MPTKKFGLINIILSIFILIIFTECNSSSKNNKKECILFYLPNCIISEAKLITFMNLYKKYDNNDIQFYVVYINKEKEESINFKFQLKSNNLNNITIIRNYTKYLNEFDINIVPCCILKKNNKIIYKGAIDDEYISIGQKQRIRSNYLEDALYLMIKNQRIKIKKTQPVGCRI